jgi:hypothetical protein
MPKLLATLHLFTMAAPALATRVEFGMQDFPRHSAPAPRQFSWQFLVGGNFGETVHAGHRVTCQLVRNARSDLYHIVCLLHLFWALCPPIAENAQRVFVALSASAEVAA